mmetsp:Transcript_31736/g.54141  ORF Transcript_31736/g.54141 Transcript_31736/m.54141 type:complete len:100 (+) Transcript_31736:1407-1706(+)
MGRIRMGGEGRWTMLVVLWSRHHRIRARKEVQRERMVGLIGACVDFGGGWYYKMLEHPTNIFARGDSLFFDYCILRRGEEETNHAKDYIIASVNLHLIQ